MAINLATQYPGKVTAPSANYPWGSARNITTPGDGTGTPWEAAIVNDFLGLQQALLTRAGVTPSGTPDNATTSQYVDAILSLQADINVLEHGLVANDGSTAARNANTAAIIALVDPTIAVKEVGRIVWPNITGTDKYYFNDFFDMDDHCNFDLAGSTLSLAKIYAAADDARGFINCIRNVTIENGNIEIDYDGSAGTNAGPAIRVGSRVGYPFGSFTDGIEDEDLSVPMGNITLRNLRINTNNPDSYGVLAFGGIDGWTCENIFIEGNAVAEWGIVYEFGFYHYEATAANIVSSHGRNFDFKNISVNNLDVTEGGALTLRGAYNAKMTNIYANSIFSVIGVTPGEALFWNVAPGDVPGAKHCITMENIVGVDVVNTGLGLYGASANTGYLSGEPLQDEDLCELYTFSLDGFAIECDGFGIYAHGPITAKNGYIGGICGSGGIVLTDECVQFDLNNIRVEGGNNYAVRGDFGANIWSTIRGKVGQIRNCVFRDNIGAAISLGNTQSVLIENNRLGSSVLYDVAAETGQTNAVSLSSTAKGVKCRGNFCTTNGGDAYVSTATGVNGNEINEARNDVTRTGVWIIDGVSFETAANIANISASINTVDRFYGKEVWDTTNARKMFSLGRLTSSAWEGVDGSGTVTPS